MESACIVFSAWFCHFHEGTGFWKCNTCFEPFIGVMGNSGAYRYIGCMMKMELSYSELRMDLFDGWGMNQWMSSYG